MDNITKLTEDINNSFCLDYNIEEVIDNYYDDCYKYDTVRWEIRIFNTKVLKELNKKFKDKFILNEPNEIGKMQAYAMYKYLSKNKNIIGMFGTRYLNPMF